MIFVFVLVTRPKDGCKRQVKENFLLCNRSRKIEIWVKKRRFKSSGSILNLSSWNTHQPCGLRRHHSPLFGQVDVTLLSFEL